MCDGKTILDDDITFSSINSDNFYFTEEKSLKEYTHEIILHHLKKTIMM